MTTFSDLGLNPMILQALDELGFEKPTGVQSKAVPHLIASEKDLIALAQTGTGKTAAFSLPLIQQMSGKLGERVSGGEVEALILCPTRELAIQVASDITNFAKYLKGVSVTPVYGGERIDKQIRELKKRPQIVVGTPGRVNDLIRRRVLKLGGIQWLVLDEADEMLNMGFKEELDEILEGMPKEKQTLLFSATMDKNVRRIASNYMNKPDEITIGDKNKGSDNVEHFYYVVHERDRYQALRRIADMNPNIHGIVFCRTKRETQKVADLLIKDHYSAEAIHGDVSQEQRIHTMDRFRDGKVQLLVATDVAARGIDVSGLTHVINYNLPESTEAYVHRSGRTGRAHNKGVSLVILNMKEKYKVKHLERKIGKSFEQGKIPSGEDICERQLFHLIDGIREVEVNDAQIDKYVDLIMKKFEGLEREELIKKFVSVEFNRFLAHYVGAEDLNKRAGKDDSRDGGRGRDRGPKMLFTRFGLNVGKADGMTVKDLLQFMNSQPELKGIEVGNIDIEKGSTMFEVDEKRAQSVAGCFQGSEFNGVMLEAVVEETGVESSRQGGGGNGGRRRGRGRGRSHGRGNGGGGYKGGSKGGRRKRY